MIEQKYTITINIKEKMVKTLQEGIMKYQTGGAVIMERKRREKESSSDVENVGVLVITRLNVPHF